MLRQLLKFVAIGCIVGPILASGDDAVMPVYSLREAVDQALLANHQYRNLLNSVEVAELDYDKARAVFRTKLKGNLNSDARNGADVGSIYNLALQKRNMSGSAYGAGVYHSTFGVKELSEIRFSYTLPFFQNPLTTGKFDANRAELDYRHRERMAKIGAEELVLDVVTTYYRLSLTDNQIDVAQGEVTVAQRLLQATRIRTKTGRSSEIDLQRADLRVSQAEQRRDTARFQKLKAQNELRLVLGLDMDEPMAVKQEIPPVSHPELMLMTTAEVEAMAIRNRAELIGLGEDLELARRKLASAPTKRKPGLAVSLQYALIGEGTTFSDSVSFDDSRVGIGITMDVDLLGNPDQQHRRLALFFDSTRRSYERLEGRIRTAVADAVFTMQNDARQLALARQSLTLGEKQFRLMALKYRGGSASTQEVLEAEQELSDARYVELTSRVNYLLSNYRVRLVAGTLLEDWGTDVFRLEQ